MAAAGQGRDVTAWARAGETPLRRFLATEAGSASVLLLATAAALVWANVDLASYRTLWEARLSLQLGGAGVSQSLAGWVNTGLMSLFFFVVGLEARREFDLGELRERTRAALPMLAGSGGMLAGVSTYLAINAGHASAAGWGVAMSTDTAFALGLLALVGPRFPDRLRSFLLTVVVVDDLLALLVIATVYSRRLDLAALLAAGVAFGAVFAALRLRLSHGAIYLLLAAAAWVALLKSGIDPVVIGLAMGLLTYAGTSTRVDLERASDLFRRFREQPTSGLARRAQRGVAAAISPNERYQQLFHPWVSFVVVPLFALANAGLVIDAAFLERAASSPITLGILAGYVIGKPLGVLGGVALLTRLSRGRLKAPAGWAAIAGGGAAAGIGFTVSLLIATLAFRGSQLAEAKLGILLAALTSSLLAFAIFRVTARLPTAMRLRALLGASETLVDLARPVDAVRDHVRGPRAAPVTLVEYGDYECPYCGRAEPVVRELLAGFGDLRYVWRHLPLTDVHPHAQAAAETAEAVAPQGRFWEIHALLFQHQQSLNPEHLSGYVAGLEVDLGRYESDLPAAAARVAGDVEGAALSGVSGTPTFFINGRRHHGAYDIETLSAAVRAAGAHAAVRGPRGSSV
ncbi:MAG: Na+/H+ antiporter NhaA [Solirubrobacteraceae bacterium]